MLLNTTQENCYNRDVHRLVIGRRARTGSYIYVYIYICVCVCVCVYVCASVCVFNRCGRCYCSLSQRPLALSWHCVEKHQRDADLDILQWRPNWYSLPLDLWTDEPARCPVEGLGDYRSNLDGEINVHPSRIWWSCISTSTHSLVRRPFVDLRLRNPLIIRQFPDAFQTQMRYHRLNQRCCSYHRLVFLQVLAARPIETKLSPPKSSTPTEIQDCGITRQGKEVFRPGSIVLSRCWKL